MPPSEQSYREIPLGHGYVAMVDEEDFERCSQHHWTISIKRKKDGSISAAYATRLIRRNGKWSRELLHRFILGLDGPKPEVDHEDHNGLNCRRHNIRASTRAQNVQNTRIRLTATSGYKGVCLHKPSGLWWSSIRVDGKKISLGYFKPDQIVAAAKAYDKAALRYFGNFACVNFPQEGQA